MYTLCIYTCCVCCVCAFLFVFLARSLTFSLSIHPSISTLNFSLIVSFFLSLTFFSRSLALSLSCTHTHRPYIPGITVNAKLLRGTVVRIPPRQGDVLRAVPPPQLFNPDLTLYAQVFFKKFRSPPLLLGIVPFSLPCSLELRASHLSITHTNTKTEAEGR